MTDNLSVFNDREQRIAAMSFKERLEKLRAGITFPPPFTYNEQKTTDGENDEWAYSINTDNGDDVVMGSERTDSVSGGL